MMERKSKPAFAIFLAAIILASSIPAKPEAAKREKGWSGNSYYKNGKKAKGLKKIGKYYYYFDAKGNAYKKGWITIKGKRYYFGKNKRAYVGVKKIGKKYYLFDTKGRRAGTGIKTYKGKEYYVRSGVIKTGLVTYKGKKYYSTRQGLKFGWVKIRGKQYYFNKNTKAMAKNRWIGGQYVGSKGYVTKTKKPSSPNPNHNDSQAGCQHPESFDLQDGLGTYEFACGEGDNPSIWFKWSDGHIPDGTYTVNGTLIEFSHGYGEIPESWYTIETDSAGRRRCRLIDGTYMENCGIFQNGGYYFFDKDGYGLTGDLGSGGVFSIGGKLPDKDNIGYSYHNEFYVNGKKVLATTRYLYDLGFTYTQVIQSRKQFWEKKTGMCAQYAAVTYELCCVAGIPVVAVESNTQNHAWNQVCIDGIWYHYDNTSDPEGIFTEPWISRIGYHWNVEEVWAGGSEHTTDVDAPYANMQFNILTGKERLSGTPIPGWGIQG